MGPPPHSSPPWNFQSLLFGKYGYSFFQELHIFNNFHSLATERCNCRDLWKVTHCAEKQDGRKNAKHMSEAEVGCNFQQDTAGSRKTCFKFYISDCNNNPSTKRFTTPSVSEFYSCMQNGLHVDIVKSDRVAVSVHESFFNGRLLSSSKNPGLQRGREREGRDWKCLFLASPLLFFCSQSLPSSSHPL